MNRTLVGVIALCCLGAALVMSFVAPNDANSTMWQAGFTRVGLLMGAFWLALPSNTRNAAWANVSLGTLAGGLLLLVAVMRIQLKILLPLVAIAAVITLVLRPRPKPTPGETQRR